MAIRKSGDYVISACGGEQVRAFVPLPLPPSPKLVLDVQQEKQVEEAMAKCQLLNLASRMVPDKDWFTYGFVRKEAVVSSQIEDTQATLMDVLETEHDGEEKSDDVCEVVNYVNALGFCLRQLASEKGLPLSLRLIKEAHRLLMKGVRGAQKTPGEFRHSQNWVGGSRPGNAKFVPPPPERLIECLSSLERYIHAEDTLPPLVRAGLVHVQFETIHPFLDGNGRVGRLLTTLLLCHWKVLEQPLLYLSLYFKRRRVEYYERLTAVRADGDWVGWNSFFLEAVTEIAEESVTAANRLYNVVQQEQAKLLAHRLASVASLRLMELLPRKPIISTATVVKNLKVSKPTAQKAIDLLVSIGTLKETTSKLRGRKFSFVKYLKELTKDTEVLPR